MSFKYCRAYSWPYNNDRWAISETYFEKMVKNAKELESKLQCNFLIIFAYEEKEFPFVLIALDLDYHLVADSEISRTLDDYLTKLGDPTPTSLENPGWFSSVDANYKSMLDSCGITLLEGEFYKLHAKPDNDNVQPTRPTTEPSEADIQNLVSHILRPDNPFANLETRKHPEQDILNALNNNEGVLIKLSNYFEKILSGGDYFYQPITSPAFCSDNQCPCDNTSIPVGDGYLYVSEGAVEFRMNARSERKLQSKSKKYIRTLEAKGITVSIDPAMYKAILICGKAARQRGLDLNVARSDAKYAWSTSKAPLRATPKV